MAKNATVKRQDKSRGAPPAPQLNEIKDAPCNSKSLRSRLVANVASVLFLSVGLIITAIVWRAAKQDEYRLGQDRFQTEAADHTQAIRARMQAYEQALRSGVALWNASETVTRNEWKTFVEAARVHDVFPGIQAMGWSALIKPEDLSAHIGQVRAEGYPNYALRPEGKRDLYASIVFVEPFDERNRQAFGYDMWSQEARRAAMERARDSGQAALSGRVKLVQEIKGKVQAGTLMYLPVYRKGSPSIATQDRRKNIQGFVYAAFRMDDLMEGILGGRQHLVNLHIYDGPERKLESLMYDSDRVANDAATDTDNHKHKERFFEIRQVEIAGRTWILEFYGTHAFETTVDHQKPTFILVGGIIGNLLLFIILQMLTAARDQAVVLARRMTKELSASEARARAIVETAVNGVITIGQDGVVQTFNPAAETIFGYLASEVIGRNIRMLMPEPYYSQHDEYLRRYLTEGQARIIGIGREVSGLRKDGSVFPMYLSIGEAHVDNVPLFVGFVVDITKRKEAEATIIAAKEAAETANRTKTKFLNIMSHELRTPLTVILGLVTPLKRLGDIPAIKKSGVDVPAPVATEVSRLADMMERNGKQLHALINDILDLSKIEAGKLDLRPEEIGAAEAVADAVAAVENWAKEASLKLTHSVPSGIYMHADRLRVMQIFNNLLSNAIKFTKRGGVNISAQPRGDKVEFRVADTGCGIPPDMLETIFSPFLQVDSSERRSKGGTGLGLAIVRRLVELQGGHIRVESALDLGSTFIFTLPLRKA